MKPRFVTFLLLLCAFALGIKSFSEPDLWWQIRTGQWILENGTVPKTDIFSYTYSGTEWINIKWGFEVLAALVSKALGPECVYVIQALVSLLIFYLLIRWSRDFPGPVRTNDPALIAGLAISFIWTAITVEFRINGRPEMFSHLFTVLVLLLLTRHRRQASNKIFWLVPIQIAWTNLHEAYAMGIFITGLIVAGAWGEKFLFRDKTAGNPWKITLAWLSSIAAVAVNPHGARLWSRPLDIFSQVEANKYTTELLPVTDAAYWRFPAWMAVLLLVTSIVYLICAWKRKENVLQKLGIGYLLVLAAFFYLALTAQRNLIFLVLAAFPLFREAVTILVSRQLKPFIMKPLAWILPILFYFLIVSNRYYKMTSSRTRFGLEITSYNNPVGAANYVQQKGLLGKSCFSDYLTSSYLLWKLQPGFKTFIDLRDLDVFPADHFQKFLQATHIPGAFLSLDSLYHFDYVVLFRPAFETLHAFLYNDSIYACTYVDAVAAVYEKTDEFTREDIFTNCKKVRTSAAADLVNHVLNPFYSSFNYRSLEYDRIAASYYTTVAQPRLVQARQKKVDSRQ